MKKPPVPVPVITPRMLNVKQAAEYIGTTVSFIRTSVWSKQLRGVIFGNRLLIDRADLDAFVERAKATA